MDYEVDVLAVGDSTRSGDAIALRYGNLSGARSQQVVITIDGGTLESGEKLVQHVKTVYGTELVDFALLTHPDMDHVSGLRSVLEGLKVKALLMHLPWQHAPHVMPFIDDERVTIESLTRRSEKNLKAAKEAEKIARSKNIPIHEPFAGETRTVNWTMRIIGPTRGFYRHKVADFNGMPGAIDPLNMFAVNTVREEIFEKVAARTDDLQYETLEHELLVDPLDTATSAQNTSSAIMLIDLGDKKLLFTGDAGPLSLEAAMNFADQEGIDLSNIVLFQIPHHGSRKNIGPTLLNRLFGKPNQPFQRNFRAFVSCAVKGHPKHPNRKVVNALIRRGANVSKTAGMDMLYTSREGLRPGYHWADKESFTNWVTSDALTEK